VKSAVSQLWQIQQNGTGPRHFRRSNQGVLTVLWKSFLIGLLAFVVALLAFSIMRSRVQPADQQNDNAAYSSAAQTDNQDESWEAFWQRTKRDPVAFFTAVLAGSTILLFVIAIGQLWFLSYANKTGEKAAKAAQQSAEIGERALIAGQRPFISAVLTGIAAKNVETDQIVQWNFTTTWTNAGTTPTRDMRNHISVKMFDGPLPDDWDFPDLWTKNSTSRTPTLLTGPARGTVQGQTVGAFTVDQIREVINRRKTLYMWGWAAYNDVFPKTARHITRFAVQIFAGGDPTDPNRMTFNFSYLDRYNCSDGECEGQSRSADWKARDLVE
jgi:hypothetical protein